VRAINTLDPFLYASVIALALGTTILACRLHGRALAIPARRRKARKLARGLVAPGEKELYPAWQGMQYLRNMFDGRAKLEPLDNDSYPGLHWTTVREVLSAHQGR